jgi:hypothetical protein
VFCFFAALCFGDGIADDDGSVLTRLRGLHAEALSLVVELDALHLMPSMALQVAHYLPRSWKLFDAQRRHHATVMALVRARRLRQQKLVGVGDSDGARMVCRTKILISNLAKTYLTIRYTAAKFAS